jgi:hypothetical protein
MRDYIKSAGKTPINQLRELLAKKEAWEFVTFDNPKIAPIHYLRPLLVEA